MDSHYPNPKKSKLIKNTQSWTSYWSKCCPLVSCLAAGWIGRCWRVRRVGSKNVTVHFWLDDRPCGNYLWVLLTLNFTIWAESTLLCSEVYRWGYQQCTSDTDGILISTGFVPNIATQYFSPWMVIFSLWKTLWLQPITSHPEWARFHLYLRFDDNTALFTPNGHVLTRICVSIITMHFSPWMVTFSFIICVDVISSQLCNSNQVHSYQNGHLFTCFLMSILICCWDFLTCHWDCHHASCTSNGMDLTLARSIDTNGDRVSKCTRYCVGVYLYQLAFFLVVSALKAFNKCSCQPKPVSHLFPAHLRERTSWTKRRKQKWKMLSTKAENLYNPVKMCLMKDRPTKEADPSGILIWRIHSIWHLDLNTSVFVKKRLLGSAHVQKRCTKLWHTRSVTGPQMLPMNLQGLHLEDAARTTSWI